MGQFLSKLLLENIILTRQCRTRRNRTRERRRPSTRRGRFTPQQHMGPVDSIRFGIFVSRWIISRVRLLRVTSGVIKVRFPPFRGTKLMGGDLDPILPMNRTWRTYNYVAYWFSDAVVVSIWQMASAFLAGGLSWQQSRGAVAL